MTINQQREWKFTSKTEFGAAMTVIVGAVGLYFTLETAKKWPDLLAPFAAEHPFWAFVMVLLSLLTIWRIIASLWFYRRVLTHWMVVLICLLTCALVVKSAHAVYIRQQNQIAFATLNPNAHADYIKLESSRFRVDIDCRGNATATRTQILIPDTDLVVIPEMDFYSSGGLNKELFRIEIKEIMPDGTFGDSIPNIIEEYHNPRSSCWLNRMLNGYKLKAGVKYVRTLELKANGAFINPKSDAFLIAANYKTEILECWIYLERPCKIDPATLKVVKTKNAGKPANPPESVRLDYGDENQIFFAVNPIQGDQYGVFWNYLEGGGPQLSPISLKYYPLDSEYLHASK